MENRPVDQEMLQLLFDIFQSDIDAHLHRGFTILPAKGLPPVDTKKQEILFNTGENREIWWVFSGMGSQWVGMGECEIHVVFNKVYYLFIHLFILETIIARFSYVFCVLYRKLCLYI